MTTENTNVEESSAAEETTDQGLNLNDLNTLRAIIDLASSRGAFKTSEMAAVGTAYNKLNNFLDQVAKQSETTEQGTEQ